LEANGISEIAPGLIYIPNGISLSHGAMPETRQLRKDKPHPVSSLASIGQLLNDLTIDLSLGVHEANEISLTHRRRSKFIGLIRGSAKT
jgi:hypothetical protein